MSYEMYRAQFDGDSFNDLLVEQLRRAPWIVISAAVHVLLGLVLWAFVRDDATHAAAPEVEVAYDDPEFQEEDVEEPVIEDRDPDPEDPPVDSVDVVDAIDTIDESAEDEQWEENKGEENLLDSESFEGQGNNNAIGPGAMGGGAFGGRRGGRKNRTRGGRRRGQDAVDRGLDWLARHQSADGRWDADDFDSATPEDPACGGPGNALHDVGVTGLALLAFLGAGETHKYGDYKQTVKRGLRWLKDRQDVEGCVGPRTDRRFTYNHAIAALALTEAYALTRSVIFKEPAQASVDFCVQCQNPYEAWRYGEQPGDNDTSVTGWMVMVLKSAQAGGLRSPSDSMKWALGYIEEMTDEETGRTGYVKRGELPVREDGKQETFPAAESESLTAVGMLSRVFAGQDPESTPAIKLGADLCSKKLPVWDSASGSIDMYYWYYASLAMYQVGGHAWSRWNKSMSDAIVGSQHAQGHKSGSWDPIGAWGEEGGRVYSTAMMTLCLEVYYRYGRLFGTK